MRLVICIKPSIARQVIEEAHLQDKARVERGYYEAENLRVTWMIGYLSELHYPGSRQSGKFKVSQLPYDIRMADIVVSRGVEAQFDIIHTLLEDSSVTEVLWLIYNNLSELWAVELLRRAHGNNIGVEEKVAFYDEIFDRDGIRHDDIDLLFSYGKPYTNMKNLFDAAYMYDAHGKMISKCFSIALSKAYEAKYCEDVHFDFSILGMLMLRIIYEKRLQPRWNTIGNLILYLEDNYKTKVEPPAQFGYWCFPCDVFDRLLNDGYISAKQRVSSLKMTPFGQKVYELALEELPAFISDEVWFRWKQKVQDIMDDKASADEVLDEVIAWIKEEIHKMPSYPQIEQLEV